MTMMKTVPNHSVLRSDGSKLKFLHVLIEFVYESISRECAYHSDQIQTIATVDTVDRRMNEKLSNYVTILTHQNYIYQIFKASLRNTRQPNILVSFDMSAPDRHALSPRLHDI